MRTRGGGPGRRTADAAGHTSIPGHDIEPAVGTVRVLWNVPPAWNAPEGRGVWRVLVGVEMVGMLTGWVTVARSR